MDDDVAGAGDNFAEVPTVMSPEPVLDLDAAPRERPLMHALPAAPPAPPRRQVLVGTALAGVAVVDAHRRDARRLGPAARAGARRRRRRGCPRGSRSPRCPSNVMLIGVVGSCVFAQWAVVRRPAAATGPTPALALGLVGLMALAVINAQAYIYNQMEPADRRRAATPAMFYAVTGTMHRAVHHRRRVHRRRRVPLPRRRIADREIVAAHALYWYVLAAVFSAVWFIVYVTK